MYCKNCGKQLPDGTAFCDSCGAATAENTQQAQPVNAVPMAPVDDATDAQSNKAMGVLAYLGILVLIPWFAAKQSRFAQYHVGQGLTLCCASIAYSICTSIINALVSAIFQPNWLGIPHPVASAVSGILGLASIFFLVLAIMGIVNAAQGQKKELPIIGKIDIISKHFNK